MPNYTLIGILFLVAAVIASLLFTLGHVVGPRSTSARKAEPFSCGNPADARFQPRMSVKFYLVALLFIVFDIEAVFLYPWAVNFRELGWMGFWTMASFMAVLGLGLLYVWRRGALDWD